MAFKKLVNLCGDKDDRSFVYKGEVVAFAYSNDYMKDEYTVRLGTIEEKKKDFIINYNNTTLGYEEKLYLEDVVVLYIEEDVGIREFFNNIKKGDKNEQVVNNETDTTDSGDTKQS